MPHNERFQKLKDIFGEYGKKASDAIARDTEIPNADTLRPTDAAAGYGLPMVADMEAAVSMPTDREIAQMNLSQREAFAGPKGPQPEDDFQPLHFIPNMAMPATVTSRIRESRLYPEFSALKAGMKEDDAVKAILAEKGAEASSVAHGAGLADLHQTNDVRKIAEGEIARLGIQDKVKKLTIANPEEYRVHEAKAGLKPGNSAGFANPNTDEIAVRLDPKTPLTNASTAGHEARHILDRKGMTKEQWAEIQGQGDVLEKTHGIGMNEYLETYDNLINAGKFSEAVALENAFKRQHHVGLKNYEMESFIDNLLRNYSEKTRPEDTEMIRKLYPNAFGRVFGKK